MMRKQRRMSSSDTSSRPSFSTTSMMTMTTMLMQCALLMLTLQSTVVKAQYHGPICNLDEFPIAVLSRDPISGNFTFVTELPADTPVEELNAGKFRMLTEDQFEVVDLDGDSHRDATMNLRSQSSKQTTIFSGIQALSFDNSGRRLQDGGTDGAGNTTGMELFYTRKCDCFVPHNDVVYCPFTVKHCKAPHFWNRNIPVGCLTENPKSDRNELMFMTSVAIAAIVIVALVGTAWGRYAITCLCSCIPAFQRYQVNHMMQHNPRQTNSLIRSYVMRNQLALERRIRREHEALQQARQNLPDEGSRIESTDETNEPAPPMKPTSLSLKTKLYKRRSYNEDDDEHAATCTICFVPLEEGDRIGALDCNHTFHKACLKQWLSRRNVCPLCQRKDVADPQFDKDDPQKTESTGS